MKKLAIIGASHFQNPLIEKAKARGIETHVFAWQCGDIGEKTADFFYPISITETDEIADKCKEIGIDGVVTIASDLANIAVAAVADKLGLVANSVECVERSTNKNLMRRTFEANGDPSPKSIQVTNSTDFSQLDLDFPVIVKPSDRSGSRGITKLSSAEKIPQAVALALEESFSKTALIEEFAVGREFSVEYISWKGEHTFLSITEKFTTGAPGFIEMGHLEPARITDEEKQTIQRVVEHALNSLGVEYGASHSEVKLDGKGQVNIIEIGSRMGGDCIGSNLVELSTGYDFVNAVIDVALGQEPVNYSINKDRHAAIRFIFSDEDVRVLNKIKETKPELIEFVSPISQADHEITDSSSRYGYYFFSADTLEEIEGYLPQMNLEEE